jgi:uncharacterized protein involved in response to NO
MCTGLLLRLIRVTDTHTHTHTHTHIHTCARTRLVGLLWTRDRPVRETSTWQRTILKNRHVSAQVGFEHTIPASECPQTDALEHVVTGISNGIYTLNFCFWLHWQLWSTIKRNTVPVLYAAFTCRGMGLWADTASQIQVHLAEKENIVM